MRTIAIVATLILIAVVETGCDTIQALDYTPPVSNAQPVLSETGITDSATYAAAQDTVPVTSSGGRHRTWVNSTPGSEGHWEYR